MAVNVLVTGASGVLGTAVFDAFKSDPSFQVVGTAHSRPSAELRAVDLTDPSKVEALISEHKPDWVIHCAAERRPDVADKDPEGARKLNADVPHTLATLSAQHAFTLIYISTDYVFDGSKGSAYEVNDVTNPLQLYGQTKLAGEKAVLSIQGPGRRVVLRVPVLYGPVRENSDSAINILVDIVKDQSGKQYKMDHYATRYPTNVLDIAAFLVRLANKYRTEALPPVIQYSAPEPYTKYEICLLLAALVKLPHEHIKPDASEPVIPPGGVGRPKDCHLSTAVIDGLGLAVDARGFREWWASYFGIDSGTPE